MIVGGPGPNTGLDADFDELMEFSAGADAPPPPHEAHPGHPAMHPHGHPMAHPGMHPMAHAMHPAAFGHPALPAHAAAQYAPHFHRGGPAAYDRHAHGPAVVEEAPTHSREFPIGFTSGTNVPAAQTVQIETKPQVLFRGERLAVPNSIVLNFEVADIKVGKDSQLAAPGNMPAECFSNVSVGVRMQLDTAEPGITITLFMENTDTANPHPFGSVLYGTVIE
mgnify:CR=1 FL=1